MLPTITDLFSLEHCQHPDLWRNIQYPWEVLARLEQYCAHHTKTIAPDVRIDPTAKIEGMVVIGPGTVIGPQAVIIGPAIIGANCQIRLGAYLRGNVVIGDDCVIGHSTELKNTLLFNQVRLPHFNYVGDSILGYQVHGGGGASTSNFKSDGSDVVIRAGEKRFDTGLRKCGAFIGDEVELGSGVILQPGAIIGPRSRIYPGAIIRGLVPADVIVKVRQQQEVIELKK